MNKNIYIGIDPAFRKDGFAMCIIDEDNTVNFRMFKSFLNFVFWLMNDAPENAVVCIENSNLQNVTFDMKGSKSLVAQKSRNAGKNQAASQYTVDICEYKWGKNVVPVSPKEKGGKWTNVEYMAVCKQEKHKIPPSYKSSNQDERDAYKLALIGRDWFIRSRR